ncbi:MAG: hypothetical protein RL095_1298 [Verrucomicrobiota bacterium]|jgi:cation:H+ antiporter
MTLPLIVLIAGLLLLIWSSGRFVDGASSTARHLGMSPLLVGIIVVGFGTSAPEMLVSFLAAQSGSPQLALGNAYGSNIANIALVLGVTALVSPIAVHSGILRRELPILLAVTALSFGLIFDGELSRIDAAILFSSFAAFMVFSVRSSLQQPQDALVQEEILESQTPALSKSAGWFWLIFGFLVLLGSSRILVWGAVEIAKGLGVSDLIIGLTILAVGTSLPELASSIAAARKNEHELALGNILGSNLFNTLMVVGIAVAVKPFPVDPGILHRDFPVMSGLTLALLPLVMDRRGEHRLGRIGGFILLVVFLAYNLWLCLGSSPG